MSAKLILDNLVAYSLQIGMLVGLAAFVPALLRLRLPGAKLVYWHVLLAACLVLPLLRPWTEDAIAADVQISTTILTVAPAAAAAHRTISLSEAALLLLAAGVLARLGWLAVGVARLRRYRRHARPLEPAPSWSVEADVCISDDVSSPVTFGWRKPVILLPAQFPELPAPMRETVLCHEVLHVRRRDWLFTVSEELVRAAFWFHPAIWWLLGEIQLAREQAVDREVIEMTKTRDEYVDALLAIAGARPQLDLAPAPLFLRRRHLKQRVISILKEVRMSKTRLVSALAAGLCMLAAACWVVTGTFPLSAAPQADASGVTVDTGGAKMMHRSPVLYPEAARAKGIQGNVVVEARLDAGGNVVEARVLSGPDELRNAALQSVLKWHYAPTDAGATRQVTIGFLLPAAQSAGARPTTDEILEKAAKSLPANRPDLPARILRSITVEGASDQAKADLLARLPVHVGDPVNPATLLQVMKAVKDFDVHLAVTAGTVQPNNGVALRISAPDGGGVMRLGAGSVPGAAAASAAGSLPEGSIAISDRIRVGGNVQQTKLIAQPRPVYPVEAKANRIQGRVSLEAVIGTDGHIKDLRVLDGDPLLSPSAMDAVKQWVYQPTLLNGNPVEVVTQIDVNYALSQ